MPELNELFSEIIKNEVNKDELYLKVGKAVNINTDDFTFDLEPNDETSLVPSVLMKSISTSTGGSFVQVPKESSFVVCAFSSRTTAFCVMVEVCDKLIINSSLIEGNSEDVVFDFNNFSISSDSIRIDCDDIIFNGGSNAELININELTSRLNFLVLRVNSLISKFNSHTHSGVSSGSSATTPPNAFEIDADTFDKNDYADSKIKH